LPFGSAGARPDPISVINANGHRSGRRDSARLRRFWLRWMVILVALLTWLLIWRLYH
jgi:hypothetical protein